LEQLATADDWLIRDRAIEDAARSNAVVHLACWVESSKTFRSDCKKRLLGAGIVAAVHFGTEL